MKWKWLSIGLVLNIWVTLLFSSSYSVRTNSANAVGEDKDQLLLN